MANFNEKRENFIQMLIRDAKDISQRQKANIEILKQPDIKYCDEETQGEPISRIKIHAEDDIEK